MAHSYDETPQSLRHLFQVRPLETPKIVSIETSESREPALTSEDRGSFSYRVATERGKVLVEFSQPFQVVGFTLPQAFELMRLVSKACVEVLDNTSEVTERIGEMQLLLMKHAREMATRHAREVATRVGDDPGDEDPAA